MSSYSKLISPYPTAQRGCLLENVLGFQTCTGVALQVCWTPSIEAALGGQHADVSVSREGHVGRDGPQP